MLHCVTLETRAPWGLELNRKPKPCLTRGLGTMTFRWAWAEPMLNSSCPPGLDNVVSQKEEVPGIQSIYKVLITTFFKLRASNFFYIFSSSPLAYFSNTLTFPSNLNVQRWLKGLHASLLFALSTIPLSFAPFVFKGIS